jgi:hypothetical protein
VPKVTQEAAASGLAQIVFGFYEAPTVIHGTNGFVVWTDEELFDRLAQLLADADLTETMGRAGRRIAEAWSWEVVAPKWEARIIDTALSTSWPTRDVFAKFISIRRPGRSDPDNQPASACHKLRRKDYNF